AFANPSPATEAQVLSPSGVDRLRVGQSTTISFRTAGLAAADPVLFLDVGANTGFAGNEVWNNWLKDSYRTGGFASSLFSLPDTTGGTAPPVIYQTSAIASGGAGNKLSFAIPVPDGSYGVRLHFYAGTSGTFDISLQGSVIRPDFDLNAAAGF